MSDRLKFAFEEAAKLPEDQQENFAEFMLAELEDENEWQRLFSASPGVLEKLAEEAREAHRTGRALPLEDTLS